MNAVLFVTNGHGEAAIAARIARELRALAPQLGADHLALVGERLGGADLQDVGPQRAMPSGGLVAMGNVRNWVRDIGAGLVVLALRQRSFIRRGGRRYRCIVAVGDAYALVQALAARRPTIFVGTAKSVYVAPYGALERRVLRAAAAVFVRDAATAEALAARGIPAQGANAIADLFDDAGPFPWPRAVRLVLLPGSREPAYRDGLLLARIAARVASAGADVCAALSVAPQLDAERFAGIFREAGWIVAPSGVPGGAFDARDPAGVLLLTAWPGPLGSLFRGATLVCGQAGTANEAAAAAGLPVVAIDRAPTRRWHPAGWYRIRQARLLGDALAVVPPDEGQAARDVAALLADADRRRRMGAAGRERMGGPGGAEAIARAIAACA